jgi:hypothetical protein
MAKKGDKINVLTLSEGQLKRYRHGLITRGLANYWVKYTTVEEAIEISGI